MPGYGLAINADRVGNLSLRQALVPQVFDLIGLIHAQMIGHQLIASVSHCKTKDNNPTNPLTRWRTFKRPSLVPFQRPSTSENANGVTVDREQNAKHVRPSAEHQFTDFKEYP
jgi:hypothetical protein